VGWQVIYWYCEEMCLPIYRSIYISLQYFKQPTTGNSPVPPTNTSATLSAGNQHFGYAQCRQPTTNPMSYSDFTLDNLKSQFNLIIEQRVDLFTSVETIAPTALLQETLEENIPLALEIDTEKARSELIVAPILVEVRKQFKRQISLFSGCEFNIDKTRGLTGRCDFLISHSPEQLTITAPIVLVVEAKNDNIKSGIPQCIAEAIAAQIFNLEKKNQIDCIYAGVTTGSIWKFLKLEGNQVFIEPGEHYLDNLPSILGILAQIIHSTKPTTYSSG